MAWSGGTFSRLYSWVTDRDAGIKILATEMDNEDNGFTTGINQCLNKDGSNAATGNLNLGGFRLTNGAAATARTDFLLASQLQDGSTDYAAGSGTNTITATLAPAITAYTNGMIVGVKFANTTTGNSTLNINSVGALSTYYSDGTTRLPGGESIANNIGWFSYDSSLNAAAGGWVLLNPSRILGSYTTTIATGLTTTPSGTINYAIQPDGKTAQVWNNAAIIGTSNATTMTATGVPAVLSAASAGHHMAMRLEDVGAGVYGAATGLNGTTWTFCGAAGGTTGNFTATGLKGIPTPSSGTYTLD